MTGVFSRSRASEQGTCARPVLESCPPVLADFTRCDAASLAEADQANHRAAIAPLWVRWCPLLRDGRSPPPSVTRALPAIHVRSAVTGCGRHSRREEARECRLSARSVATLA